MDEIRRATNGSVQLQIVQRYKPELNQAKGGRYYVVANPQISVCRVSPYIHV